MSCTLGDVGHRRKRFLHELIAWRTMMLIRVKHKLHGLAAVATLGICPQLASAEPITGLTVQNELIFFDSATPGLVWSVSITGVAAGDTLVGIDRRPQFGPNNGVLYSVGVDASGTGRIYSLDETSGAATLVSTLSADPTDTMAPFPYTTVSGSQFGIDFNPTVDRLRVTSDTGQNLRINVDNGLTNLDGPLAYDSMDANAGLMPADVAVAYSNNFGGAATTVLRGVDIARNTDLLVIHTNPNGGTLASSLVLPFNATMLAYDVSGFSGTPYFAPTGAGGGSSGLFAGTNFVGTIGGGVAVRGIAAPVGTPVPEPGTMALVATSLAGLIQARRRRGARTQRI
jgi:hypothetical protein